MKKMMKIFGLGFMCSAMLINTACSDDTYGPDPEKDWAATTEYFNAPDEQMSLTYFKPAVGRVGDPMPFYDPKAQDFKVLYLQEHEKNTACYHPFWGVSTVDGANYEVMGEVLPTGNSVLEADAALGTGCVVYNEQEGLYYIYYTGHTAKEVVLRATSPDFKNWTKDYAWVLNGRDYGYSAADFRDPQVFKADDGLWRMVVSTYPGAGGNPVFAEFKSSDLKNWEHVGSFEMLWDRMLECADVFKMGSKWYFIYSESARENWSRKVKYMMADSWQGLKDCFNNKWWPDAAEGRLQNRSFYAAKTASNGTDRYIWGWCPYRVGEDVHAKNLDLGVCEGGEKREPRWSGALVCHKLVQNEDGTLRLAAVPALADKYSEAQEVRVVGGVGYANGQITGEGYVLYNRLGYHNHISLNVTADKDTKFGISLVRATDVEKYYTLLVEPMFDDVRRIFFVQEGSGAGNPDSYKWTTESDEFKHPADNVYHIDIYTDNSVVTMYINNVRSYTQRVHGIQRNCWSVNSYGGTVAVSDVKVSQY